jgi:hypothetical protein
MKRGLAALCALASALALAACATPVPIHQAMPADARTRLATTDVVVPVKQNEIYIYVPPSQMAMYGGGGLILALLDASVDSNNANTAEEAVGPLRNALVDFNFDQVLQTELKTALAQASWLNASGYQVVKEVSDANFDKILTGSQASAVLFVSANYTLNWSGDSVSVSISPFLFPKTTELAAMVPAPVTSGPKTSSANALYRNVMTFRDRAPNATDEREANLVTWSAQNAAVMRASLQRAATKLAAMLMTDLHEPLPPIDPKTTKLPTIVVDNVTGYIVRTDAEGSLVQFPTGTQMYITTAAQAQLPKKPPARPKAGDSAPKGSY